ncbi:transmembrane protein, putative [Bodo saltans]|uniref:Transmembrane protein, putative n=1 Tax=Bodo saltans TaxID=75058 RepID=A0A0S4J189_BODSA|nr:transmembrane protein, putative [Bodo saltans]|eukprot:CUG41750.1 transmembrane protein, putative [Bodo saltans]
MIVDTLFHVALFLLAFMLLFTVRKVGVRHHPTRLTSIPREQSESCQWLQHLFDGVFDMFTTVFAVEYIADIERKVGALLEDKGLATRAQLKIHSVGTAPPHLVAIRGALLPSSRGGQQHHSSTTHSLSTEGVTSPIDQGNKSAASISKPTAVDSDLSSPDIGPSQPPVAVPFSMSSSPSALLASSLHRLRHETLLQTTPLVGPLELEFMCEYSGGASATLDADIPIIRGRQLQVSVGIAELTLRTHCKLVVRLRSDEGNGEAGPASNISPANDTKVAPNSPSTNGVSPAISALEHPLGSATPPPPQPSSSSSNGRLIADVVVHALSEPAFSFELRTTASQYGIHNFFGFAIAVKYFILRWVRLKLMSGLRFEVPLPPDWTAPRRHHPAAQTLASGDHQGRAGSMFGSTAHPPATARSKSVDTPLATGDAL